MNEATSSWFGTPNPPNWRSLGRWLLVYLPATLMLAACLGDESEHVTMLPERLELQVPAQAEVAAPIPLGSSAGSTEGLQYLWQFGDGGSSSDPSPTHAYLQPGTYRLALQISNGSGQTRSAEASVLVGRFTALQASSGCTGAGHTGWCQQWPLDSAREIKTLVVRGGTQAFGAGSDGQIYYTDGPNRDWRAATMDTAARTIESIRFTDSQTGWAFGVTALPEALPGSATPARAVLLLKSSDAGKSWIRLEPKLSPPGAKRPTTGISLQLLDSSHLILADADSQLRWVSSDGGNRWTASPWPAGDYPFDKLIYPRTGNLAWSVDRDPSTREWRLKRSRDLGITFEAKLRLPATDLVVDVEFADDLHGWVMTSIPNSNPQFVYPERETFWHTDDGGETWTYLGGPGLGRGPIFFSPPGVKFLDATTGVAQNSYCGILKVYSFYRSLDAGRSWQPISGPPDRIFQDLTTVSASVAWTSGQYQCGIRPPNPPPRRGIFLTRDLGQSWQYLEVPDEPVDSPVRRVLIADDESIQLTYEDQIYRSADGGITWTKMLPAATSQLESVDGKYAVAFSNPTNGLAISASGRLLSSSDGGQSWQPQGLVVADPAAPDDKRKALNQRGRIQPIDADSAWIVGADGVHRVSKGGTHSEQRLATGDGSAARDLFFTDANRGWVIKSSPFDASDVQSFQANPPRIWATSDTGLSWREQARLDFQPHGLHFANALLGLVVGEGGVILRTSDGGVSWSRRPSGTDQDLNRVRFVDATTAWAIGAPGAGVRVSHDAGLSWQPAAVDSPQAWNGLYFVDPLHGWIVGDFGSIASTRDGGRNWVMQKSGTTEHLFDIFAIDAETAWTVGERGVIRATASGGD